MMKQILYSMVAEKSRLLTDLSDAIWEYAELSMAETKSADYYCDLMSQPELLRKARAEFDTEAAEGYDCPIDETVTITVG